MNGGYLSATFVNGPWNGSVRAIEAKTLIFDVMLMRRKRMGSYVRVPGFSEFGGVAFAWEPDE